ncbi:MAG TPA: [protein-PII] uridylyltransferase [Actinomycetes bacterium]|nr:[protein-PII] uridylyltransferase [Actinomycetes bacterium]
MAVVAVGGYGRGELSPHSDVDLLLLLGGRSAELVVRELLYPLWDAGFQVGHAVCTPREALERARRDRDAATALLPARLVAGPAGAFQELLDRRRRWLDRDGRRLARLLLAATAERHQQAERAGWVLAPDLKNDVGGLRDLHLVAWLGTLAAAHGAAGPPRPELAQAGELLLAVREALHGQSRRKLDRIRMDLQPAVAAALGLGDGGADRLMAAVHTAARTVEQVAAEEVEALAGALLEQGPRRTGSVRRLAPGVRLEDGVLIAEPDRSGDQLVLAVRVLACRAAGGRPVAPATRALMARAFRRPPVEAWSPALRAAFLELLGGPHVVEACELLDHLGGWAALLPEWAGVRGRAQHVPWHRYTVDGHAFATVAEARRLAGDPLAAGDLDVLGLAALLHDVGKGSGEDHSVAGERLARHAGARMGLGAGQVDDVAALVRHHLLLVDTATRRDLDDPAVVAAVAASVGDPRRLRLLYLLTVADGLATGPAAWSDWKNALVAGLCARVAAALERGAPPGPADPGALAEQLERGHPALAGHAGRLLATLPATYPASADPGELAGELELLAGPLAAGAVRSRVDPRPDGRARVVVCVPDRPGALARTAGVLALHRVSVLRAQAWSTSDGAALQRFLVEPLAEPGWERLRADLEAAWSGRLAVEARLERKARDYRAPAPVVPDVRVLADASEAATVVEVRAHDALGLLYAVTAALGDLDLDIRTATIDTRGERVVDAFYVTSPRGAKLTDAQAAELTLAVRHRVARLLGG